MSPRPPRIKPGARAAPPPSLPPSPRHARAHAKRHASPRHAMDAAARARVTLRPVRWAWLAPLLVLLLLLVAVAPAVGAAAASECECGGAAAEIREEDARGALRLKLIAVASILASGATGVLVPVLGRSASALRPDGDVFFAVKAFAAGVILATGMVHILPAAFDALAPPCGGRGRGAAAFPFAGLVAMCSAMVTMMVDSVAAGYYQRSHFRKARPVDDAAAGGVDEEGAAEHAGHVHVHTHATHGHAHGHAHDHGGHGHAHGHGAPAAGASPDDASAVAVSIRHRVISQVSPLTLMAVQIRHSHFLVPKEHTREIWKPKNPVC